MKSLSVIIPSYNCKYASRTVDDIFNKASGEVEVIILLDNYNPDPPINEHKNLIVVRKGKTTGMRDSINKGVQIASGKYVMKLDDHCILAEGFDEVLLKDIQPDWLSVPKRCSIDASVWKPKFRATEYEYMAYPYATKSGIGLYSKKWLGEHGNDPKNMGELEYFWKEDKLKDILIDDKMIIQGSCWCMSKQHFMNIGGLFDYKTMYHEPQELTFKTWLSGGRVIINKNTWYAHMFKGKDFGEDPNIRGYTLDLHAMRETEREGTYFWMNDRWPKAIRKMKWLIEKFWPIPGWPEDWEYQKMLWEKQYLKGEHYVISNNTIKE